MTRHPSGGPLLGVCADLSGRAGLPAWAVRAATAAALLLAFEPAAVLYCLAALLIRLERR